jgi:endonuclease III
MNDEMGKKGRGKKERDAFHERPFKSARSIDDSNLSEFLVVLRKAHPNATCALHYSNPLELLVATILSAQCTDERVNKVTPGLFKKYPKAPDYARAPAGQLENETRSTGFFRQKAKSIRGACRLIHEKFNDQVPQSMDDLITLPGVARKTANVVLGTAFGIASGIVVDTHVKRLSFRMGLTREKDPYKIEKELMEVIPKGDWILFGHTMIWHGRTICQARAPQCPHCPLEKICPKTGVA